MGMPFPDPLPLAVVHGTGIRQARGPQLGAGPVYLLPFRPLFPHQVGVQP